MRYRALACDYDGTLAAAGQIDDKTAAALVRLRESGRRLFMVTGRELEELLSVCPQIGLFDCVVAENGALIYDPASTAVKLLAEPPPTSFVNMLRQRGATPFSVGRSIVATLQPYDTLAHDTIRDLGLELQVILNKGSVMILPAGVTKASGLKKALRAAGLSPRNAVAIGDAENDHALLGAVEFGVAVSNALPSLRERADLVTTGGFGHGVQELIDLIVGDDLASLDERVRRRRISLGPDDRGEEVLVSPYGQSIAFVADSKGAWPAKATAFLAQLVEAGYQYCAIGRNERPACEANVVLGSHERAPDCEEIVKALESPSTNVAVDLSSSGGETCGLNDALRGLAALRARMSRPHWIVLSGIDDPSSLESLIDQEPELRGGLAWIVDSSAAAPRGMAHVVRGGGHETNGSGHAARDKQPSGNPRP